MKKNELFKIQIKNWLKYNSKAKKTYKATMIQNSLVSDAKINALPLSNKWLYINLLLICGDHANDTITLTQRQVNDILTTREGAHNALDRLQSLQLVNYEKTSLIEMNRIERNRKEENTSELLKPEQPKLLLESPENLVPPEIKPKKLSLKKSPQKQSPVRIKTFEEFAHIVGREIMDQWLKVYGDEVFLTREVDKSFAWMLSNPQKSTRTPKGWRQFYNNWFSKAFDDLARKSPANKKQSAMVFNP